MSKTTKPAAKAVGPASAKLMGDLYKTADFKAEKHVPVIELPDEIVAGEPAMIKITVGQEIPHPNTSVHHIRWIKAIFMAEGAKFPTELGFAEFNAHGEGADGADTSGIYTEPQAIFVLKTDKPGKIIATSYCNIHGYWESDKAVTL